MKRPSLDGCLAKIERAREHLDSLYASSEAAVKSSASKTSIEDEGEWKVLRIALGKFPLRPSMVSGDLVHNLRSALDHLVWQLVKVSKSEPGGWTYFPIYGNEDDFIRDVVERASNRGKGPLHGIDPDGPIWTLIESYQPYANANPDVLVALPDLAHPEVWKARATHLGTLSALSRVDKHRTIHGVNTYVPTAKPVTDSLSWNPDAILLEQRVRKSSEPLEDRAELARLRFDPSGPEPNVRVSGPIFVQIGFEADFGGGESITVVVEGFGPIIDRAEEIITAFQEFFPEKVV